jgi:outer membrane lipoprotein-sorting protein
LDRPEDDYDLTLTIEKATFNQPIPAEKFDLKKPEGVEVIDLSAPQQGATDGK